MDTRIREMAIEVEGIGQDEKEFIRIDVEDRRTGSGFSYRFEAHNIKFDVEESRPSSIMFSEYADPPSWLNVALKFNSHDMQFERRQWGAKEPMDTKTTETKQGDDLFTPIRPTGIVGWQYMGEEIPDDVILAFAKSGYIMQHVSNEDNDYDGAYCTVEGTHGEKFRYEPGKWIVLSSATRWANVIDTTMLSKWEPV